MQCAYGKGHKAGWNETKILHVETNSRYRKYKVITYASKMTSSNPV